MHEMHGRERWAVYVRTVHVAAVREMSWDGKGV